MGILDDVLNGMMNGPRGQKMPQPGAGAQKGMSPMTLALLAFLAYKAYQSGMFGGGNKEIPGGSPFPPLPGDKKPGETIANSGGGLTDLLGSLIGGGAAGSILSGGLDQLLKQLQQNGQGSVADSWVSTGSNKPIAPKELEGAVGDDVLDSIAKQFGVPRDQVLSELSKNLPNLVDMLTPNGRMPTDKEISRFL